MTEAPIKVLMVEDNPAHAYLLQELLADQRDVAIDLTHIDTLEKAFPCFEDETLDVVLLDLSLPESDGLDTIHEVLPRTSHIPVIVMTSNDDKRMAVQAVQEGAQDFLVKGQVDGALIAQAIRYALERHRLRTESERYFFEVQVSE